MPELSKLNDAQQRAVTWGEGPLLVLAGPGSGKTHTITNRILYLLEKHVPGERILVITFTREAALSMQKRFLSQTKSYEPVLFGTFHSVFYHILLQAGFCQKQRIINNSQKKKLILQIMAGYQQIFERNEINAEDAGKLLCLISYYKNTGDLEKTLRNSPLLWREYFPELMRQYQKRCKEKGLLDFDDMLYECYTLLKNNEKLRGEWQRRFQAILIDEFQDINPIQYEVIKLLSAKPYNIMAVGDDDQSIYSFRGADPSLLKRFEQDYQAKRILLDQNYRSVPLIVNSSLKVINENRNRYEKELSAANAEDDRGIFRIKSFETREEQTQHILERIKEYKTQHTGNETCAILFRTNAFMQGMASRLRHEGFSFVMNEKATSIYEHFIVKDMMAYLMIANGIWDRAELLRIINRPSRYISREAVSQSVCFDSMLSYYRNAVIPETKKWTVLQTIENLKRQLQSIRQFSISLAIRYIRKAVGYEEFLRKLAGNDKEQFEEWIGLCDWLEEDARFYPDLKTWGMAQEEYNENLYAKKETNQEIQEHTGLYLMTIHAAKGLEFDTVLIPDCNEGTIPNGRQMEGPALEEERRIFYVAMTRAKRNLELFYLTGDKTRPRFPSRFLRPLKDQFSSSINSSNSQLSRYSSNASETFS